ncbi:MAG: methyl-accepting chemotaxis sensory [Desulfovibrionaceae bacterium]|nr:MAG: methyl-accepting chemotaxis sensory [Desulfovibrionaceae bacterium]
MSLKFKLQVLSLVSVALILVVWLPAWLSIGKALDAAGAGALTGSLAGTRQLLFWSGLGAMALALASGAVLGFGLTGRVRDILEALTRAENGDLGSRCQASGSDEIARIAAEINTLLTRVQELFAQAREHESQADASAQQCQLAMSQAAQSRQRAENSRRQGMGGASGTLRKVVGEIQNVASSLSTEVDGTAEAARRQADMVLQTAFAVEQLDQAVMEAARNASGASELAARARDRAEHGAGVVEAVLESITAAHARTMELKDVVSDLGVRSESIGRIMTVISDIADQTNLLALNAAIEAARAGDAGRGFAVVADEVRKLAEKTMEATREVGQVIQAIQSGARDAASGMENAAAEVERATGQARQSGEALGEIVSIVEATSDQVRSIATAAEQQSAASTQIGRTVNSVRDISTGTLDGMNRCEQGLDTLLEQVGALANLNSVFTLLGQGVVQDVIEQLACSPELVSLERVRMEAGLRKALADNAFLELAYITDASGRQVVSNIPQAGFTQQEGQGFGKNWSSRPWFTGAVKNKDIFISEVYVSSASNAPCITVSRPIETADGTMLGVLGLDVKLN